MRFVLVPFAGYVLLYAPGHAVLRRAQSVTGEPSRLLREVVLSACCTSWVGFVLAELGCFSLPLLLALLGGGAFATSILQRHAPRGRYGRRDVIGLAVWLFACLWVAPPFDTHLSAADSTGYLAGGAQLARHGTLVIHDPTLAHLSVDLKRALFPSVAPERGAPPYLRLSGSLILRSLDSDAVLPAFHHLITVWVAAADAATGTGAGQWIITLFGGLSIWAIVECATLLGTHAGLVLPLLLLSGIQYWYSRFLMPEVAGQFFLWAGLACMVANERTARASDAALAGLAFGIAGLTRAENAVFLLAALVVVAVSVRLPRTSRRQFALLLGCAAVVWLHSGIHLAVFRTHYFGVLRQLLLSGLPTSLGGNLWLASMLIGVIGAFFLWWQFPARRPRSSAPLDYALLVGLVAVSLWGGYRTHWSSLRLLVACIGAPTLAGGGIGLLLLLKRGGRLSPANRLLVLLTVLVFAQVMLEPHAQPVPIWTARRALTVVFPAACVGLALLCQAVRQRWHWSVAALILCAGLAGEARLFWELRSESSYYRGATRHVQAIAALIAPGAALLVDGQLVASGVATSLWTQRDLPTYFFSAGDSERIAQLAAALAATPVYWISDGQQPLPHGRGIELIPVALYEFVITTPMLDAGSPLGSSANWQTTMALYRFRGSGHE
jgi:hypothetical protein